MYVENSMIETLEWGEGEGQEWGETTRRENGASAGMKGRVVRRERERYKTV